MDLLAPGRQLGGTGGVPGGHARHGLQVLPQLLRGLVQAPPDAVQLVAPLCPGPGRQVALPDPVHGLLQVLDAARDLPRHQQHAPHRRHQPAQGHAQDQRPGSRAGGGAAVHQRVGFLLHQVLQPLKIVPGFTQDLHVALHHGGDRVLLEPASLGQQAREAFQVVPLPGGANPGQGKFSLVPGKGGHLLQDRPDPALVFFHAGGPMVPVGVVPGRRQHGDVHRAQNVGIVQGPADQLGLGHVQVQSGSGRLVAHHAGPSHRGDQGQDQGQHGEDQEEFAPQVKGGEESVQHSAASVDIPLDERPDAPCPRIPQCQSSVRGGPGTVGPEGRAQDRRLESDLRNNSRNTALLERYP
jgi:hypothetical protein